MAEGGRTERLQQIVECPVCRERLQSPKSLSCGHTFCEPCLNNILTHTVHTKLGQSHLQCPTCRQATAAPADASMLPTNFISLDLLEEIDRSEEPRVISVSIDVTLQSLVRQVQHLNTCMLNDKGKILTLLAIGDLSQYERGVLNSLQTESCVVLEICQFLQSALTQSRVSVQNTNNINEDASETTSSFMVIETETGLLQEYRNKMEDITRRRVDIITRLERITNNSGTQDDDVPDFPVSNVRSSQASTNFASTSLSSTIQPDLGRSSDIQWFEPTEVRPSPESLETQNIQLATQARPTSLQHPARFNPQDTSRHLQLSVPRQGVQTDLIRLAFPTSLPESEEMSDVPFIAKVSNDREHCNIVGIAVLPDLRIVLADKNNKNIKAFDANRRYLSCLSFSIAPGDITWIGGNELAATLPITFQIIKIRLTVEKLEEIGKINVGSQCWGITSNGNKMYVSCGSSRCAHVQILHSDGTIQRIVKLDSFYLETPYYIAVSSDGNRVFVSDPGTDTSTVVCVGLQDQTRCIFTYSDASLKKASGIEVDDEGNVLVCAKSPSNIHLVSSSGRKIRHFLEGHILLGLPRAICLNREHYKLFVFFDDNDYIHCFNIS